MGELCGELRFPSEASDGALVSRDVWMKKLERNLATEAQITHTPHGSERSRADGGEHLVIVGERPAQPYFLGLVIGDAGFVTGKHDHRSAADDAIDRAQHRGHGREAGGWIRAERAVDDRGNRLRGIGTQQMDRRRARRGRKFSR